VADLGRPKLLAWFGRACGTKGGWRGLLVVLLAAGPLIGLAERVLPFFLPTSVPLREYSGFFPPRATVGYLTFTALAFFLLVLAWRWAAGRRHKPMAEALVTALVFLVAQEFAARQFLERLPRSAYVPHPLLRWDLPGFERSRGRGEPAPPRRDGEFRVLCLGDSATYGVGVQTDQSWPQRAQAGLEPHTSRDLRFINHGVPGYSTFQAMAWLEREGRALKPDLVLFASCHNDCSDSDEADPDWIGRTPWQRSLRRAWMSPTLTQLLRSLTLPPPRDPGIPARQRAGFRVSLEQRRAALDRALEVCREEEVPLVLVLMPQALRPWPADAYIRDFRRYARENGLPLADGQQAAEEAENWSALFPPGDIVHPTAEGQREVARAVAGLLRLEGLVPSR